VQHSRMAMQLWSISPVKCRVPWRSGCWPHPFTPPGSEHPLAQTHVHALLAAPQAATAPCEFIMLRIVLDTHAAS
jgi:hypothetical protein